MPKTPPVNLGFQTNFPLNIDRTSGAQRATSTPAKSFVKRSDSADQPELTQAQVKAFWALHENLKGDAVVDSL